MEQIEQAKMTGWYDPMQLLSTARLLIGLMVLMEWMRQPEIRFRSDEFLLLR